MNYYNLHIAKTVDGIPDEKHINHNIKALRAKYPGYDKLYKEDKNNE